METAIKFTAQTRKSLKKLTYASLNKPGIDLAVVIALGSSAADVVSLFLPWLVGINPVYVRGKGLSYTIAAVLSGFDLLPFNMYLSFVLLPLALTLIVTYFSLKPEGIIPPRVGYKTKSRILLLLAMFSSMLPSFVFVQYFTTSSLLLPRLDVFVGRWEMGGGATMPIYAGFGLLLGLGLKIIKD